MFTAVNATGKDLACAARCGHPIRAGVEVAVEAGLGYHRSCWSDVDTVRWLHQEGYPEATLEQVRARRLSWRTVLR